MWLLPGIVGLPLGQPGRTDPEAAVVLEDAVESCGGRGVLASLVQTVAEGTATAFLADGPLTSDITIQRQGFLKSRTVSRRPGFVQESVNDGNFAWSVTNGFKQAFTDRSSARRIDPVNPLTGVLRAYALGKTTAEFAGEEGDGEQRLYRIALLLPDEDPGRLSRGHALQRRYELLVDAHSLLPAELRVASDGDPDSSELPERWYYSDYRSVEGALVPFQIEMEHSGNLLLRIQLTSFRSAPLADVFGEPSGGR